MGYQSYDRRCFLEHAKIAAEADGQTELAAAVQALIDQYCADIEIQFVDEPEGE
jgi:hypothetical protein